MKKSLFVSLFLGSALFLFQPTSQAAQANRSTDSLAASNPHPQTSIERPISPARSSLIFQTPITQAPLKDTLSPNLSCSDAQEFYNFVKISQFQAGPLGSVCNMSASFNGKEYKVAFQKQSNGDPADVVTVANACNLGFHAMKNQRDLLISGMLTSCNLAMDETLVASYFGIGKEKKLGPIEKEFVGLLPGALITQSGMVSQYEVYINQPEIKCTALIHTNNDRYFTVYGVTNFEESNTTNGFSNLNVCSVMAQAHFDNSSPLINGVVNTPTDLTNKFPAKIDIATLEVQ